MIFWLLSNYCIARFTNPRMFAKVKYKALGQVRKYMSKVPILKRYWQDDIDVNKKVN